MEQYEFDPCDSRDETPLQHKSYQDLIHDLSSYDKDGKNRLERPKNKRCEVCGKSARTPSDLLRHMRVHTGERPFPCVACQKTFKCKRSQLTHQYLSHGIRDGLSDHRLGVLDHRKVKRSSPGTKQQLKSNFCHQVPDLIDQIIHNNYLQQQQMTAFAPEVEKDVQSGVPVVDQDEDTEIVAGEEISNDGGPVSFVGLFGDDLVKKEVEDPAPEEEESPENLRGQSLTFTEDQTNKDKDCFPKVPVLRIKTHKCTHCKRQFRSIYTLRYHLRSMHDEKVYLSPALETRLKKRRWIPPHVRLQKSSSTKVSHSKKTFLPTYPNEKIEQKFLSQAEEQQAIDLHVVKKEKAEEDDINNNDGKAENNNGNGTDSKQLPFFGGPSNPFVLPPHIFFPSTPTADEGLLLNEKPISWESLQVTSDSTLISKLEAVHPVTQQKYVLYKCGLCGKAFASLRVICGHVAVHGQEQPRQDCDKCGASFKWRNELDTHLQCHSSPFLPSYLVNPFPIPVTPFFPMPFPFFALQPSQQMQQQQQNQETDAPSSSPHEAEDKTSGVFQCKLCPKTFDRIFSLQRHERIHSGLKACFCRICGRGFSELRNLRHHIIRFHAESTQPLPYRRRPNRLRNVNSSQKLVSFLKKTAVRILNSMSKTDTHTKEDGKSESMKRKEQTVPRTEEPSVNEHANSSNMPKLFDATSPTQVSPSTDVGEVPPPKLSPEDAKETEQSIGTTVNGSVEVLQDPKRSLLGNRRKGRPFKLSSKGKHGDVLFSLADSAFLEKSLSECSLLQATEILNGCLKSPELTLPPQLSYLNPEPSSDEPIDMRNPVIRDKNPDPPPSTPAFPTAPENNSTLKQPNETTSALKLPEAFESRCLFPCSYCHKSFNSITDINRHMSFHADIRPFKCPYCSYCSRTNSQLKVHMMRHEGIKHYMCQICNYNGVTQSDLNRHLKTRTHLLRSRNVCACCGTGFHTRSLSDEHYKSCHLASQNANESTTAPQQPAPPPPTDTKSNRNRVTRLKQFRGGEEAAQIKTEFYQKLCDLNSMGMTLLQQQQAASLASK